jgi:hypothetical protein
MSRRLRLLPLLHVFVAASVALSLALAQGCGPVRSDVPASASMDGGALDVATANDASGAGYTWDASACAPGDVQTFLPGPYVPASKQEGACAPELLGPLYDDCFGPQKTVSACLTFQKNPSYSACYACVVTPSTASSYGPIIDYDQEFLTPNVAGCIELAAHGTLTCAMPVQALGECELAACEANCPVSDASSFLALEACTAQAEAAGCQAYSEAVSCFTTELDAGPLSVCDASDFQAFFEQVVPLFCGQDEAGSAPSLRDASSD